MKIIFTSFEKKTINSLPRILFPGNMITYNGRWMHRLRGSEDAVQRLHEICLDACEQELADTIYW